MRSSFGAPESWAISAATKTTAVCNEANAATLHGVGPEGVTQIFRAVLGRFLLQAHDPRFGKLREQVGALERRRRSS